VERVKINCSICKKEFEHPSDIKIPEPFICYDCQPAYLLERYKEFSNTNGALEKIGVPKIFLNAHVDQFAPERIQRLPDKIEAPGLLLTGEPSVGKSHLAAALTRRELRHYIAMNNQKKPCGFSAKWANAHQLLMEIRHTFNRKDGYSEMDLVKAYVDYEYLVIDDLGTEKQSEWALTTLTNIVDGRMNLEKVTVITSNLSIVKLIEIDTRLAARLMAYTIVKFKGENKRKNEKIVDF